MQFRESIYPNNATYVFADNWQELSQLTKAQILNGGLQNARLIHKENWKEDIKKYYWLENRVNKNKLVTQHKDGN